MKKIFINLINWYQYFLSPDHSFWAKSRYPFGYCRFHPTCSEYAKESLEKHGLVTGFLKLAFRILRCNPFSSGGIDHA